MTDDILNKMIATGTHDLNFDGNLPVVTIAAQRLDVRAAWWVTEADCDDTTHMRNHWPL